MKTGKAPMTGKRDGQVQARDRAIGKAAMSLAKRGKWPSPVVVAAETAISVSVVEREIGLLTEARREWVRRAGRKHPQWRDEADTVLKEADAAAPIVETSASVIDIRTGATMKAQRGRIRHLSSRVVELEELSRRMLLGVRPSEVARILETGSPKGTAGKADKRVGVGAQENAGGDRGAGDVGEGNDEAVGSEIGPEVAMPDVVA